MLGSSPLGNTSLGNSDDSSNNIIFNAAFTQITASDAVQQIFSFDETAQFIQLSEGAITQTFGTQSFPSTISENTIGETTVSGTLTTAMGLYQYDFEAFGLQIGVNDTVVFRPALREFFTEIAAPIIAANDSIQQKFIFDTQLNINLGDFDIAYEFEGLTKELKAEYPMLPIAPISANAIGEIQWEGEQDFQPSLIELTIGVVDDIIKTFIRDSVGNIEIAATDNQGPGVVRPADGVIEYPHFRPVLRVNAEDNITIEIDLIDDPSSAYAFPSPGIDRLIREPGLPLGPLTVSTISEEQYEGTMDFQPSLLELTLNEPSPIEVIIDYPEDVGTLELSVDQTIVFRPALREFFTETAPLSVAALDSTYLFTYPLLYSNVSPGLPIGPITVGSIAEEQIILGSLAELFEYNDVVPLILEASSEEETNRIEIEFDTVAVLVVDSLGVVTARYPREDTIEVEISSSDIIGKKFVFVDTLSLEIDITETIRSRQVFRTTLPVRLNAVATVKNVYDIEDSENLEIEIPASQKFRYQTPAVVIPLEIDTTVSNLNIYKPFQGRKFRKTFSVNQTLTVGATQRQYNIDFNANTTSIIELQELINDLNSAVNRSGYTLRNQNLFLSFWKNGVPQFAVRQSSVGSATNPTRYTFNKPRFNYNYNNTTNVGTLIWDTNPQSDFFTLANATFNGVTYNRTTTNDFEFDEIRMYSGDVANSSSLLLWSGGLPAPAINLTASSTQYPSYIRETQLDVEISEAGVYEIAYTYATSGGFEVGETHLNEITYNFTETAPLIVDDTAIQSSTRTFVDTVSFSKLGADSVEIASDVDTALLNVISATDEISVVYSYQDDALLEIDESQITIIAYAIDETVPLEINETHDTVIIYNSLDDVAIEINAEESIQQLFVFDDTAEFEKVIVDSFEIVLDYDTVVFNSFAATDSIEQLFVFDDTATVEITAGSPEIISEASTLEIELAATDTIEQLFVFDDTAEFVQLGVDSFEIVLDYDTVVFNAVAATDSIEQLFVFDDTVQFVKIGADSIQVATDLSEIIFNSIDADDQIEFTYNYTENAGLEVSTTDSIEQLFVFDDTAQFAKIIADSIEITVDLDTVLVNTFEVLEQVEFTQVYDDTTDLEIAASSPEIISEASTLEIDIGSSDNIEQTFVYDDTAEFIQLGVESIEVTLDYDTVLFNVFAATDSIEQLFVYDDTAEFIKLSAADISVTQVFDTITASTISISDVVTTSLTNSDFTELEVDADIVLNLSEGSVGSIEIAAADQIEKVTNIVSTAPLVISSTVEIEQLFVFDDTAQFTQINADTVEVTLDYDTVLFNAFAATDSVEQLFVFDDTATFAKLGADSIEIIRDYDTVVFNAFGVTDAIETLHVITDSVDIEVTAFSPEIISEASTLEIEIAATDSIEQLFVFDDTAEFVQLGVESIEVTFDYDTVVFNAVAATDSIEQLFVYDDSAEFIKLSADSIQIIRDYDTVVYPEISAVDTFTIVSDLSSTVDLELDITQAIGITETSTGVLIVVSTSTQSIAYNFDDSVDFVKLGVTSEEVTITSTENVALEISATSTESITYVFDDTAQFVNLVATSTQIIRDYDTLLINSFDVETVTSSTLNRTAVVPLEIESPSSVNVIYNYPLTTIELEIETTDTTAVTYNYADEIEFVKIIVEDIDYIAVYDTITASSIEAVDSFNIVSNVVDQVEIIVGDASTQSFTYVFDDSAEFVKLGVTSTEISVNIENEGTLQFGIVDEITFVYAISSTPFVEIESTDNVSKTVSDKSVGYIEVDANTFAQGYTLFQQIYANDTIELKVLGQGDGLKITGAQQVSRQIWIG